MTNQLRPITYRKPIINHRGETWAYEDPRPGWFHQFTEQNSQFNAVIETKQGEILILPIEAIRFTNNPIEPESEN